MSLIEAIDLVSRVKMGSHCVPVNGAEGQPRKSVIDRRVDPETVMFLGSAE